MKPIDGKVGVAERPDIVAPVAVSRGHLSAAEYLLPAARFLVEGPATVSPGLALLCGHILESLLKAFLIERGGKPQRNHGLAAFWLEAVEKGLPLAPTLPPWAQNLNNLHNNPYHLRYPKVHVITTPTAEQMVSELTQLLETVRARIA
jgi:HEPN domain-containing protein